MNTPSGFSNRQVSARGRAARNPRRSFMRRWGAGSFGRALHFRLRLVMVTVIFLLATSYLGMATEAPAPEGCHWERIPEVKVTLAMPDGWQFHKVSGEKNLLVYAAMPGGADAPANPKTRYELRIQRGLPPKSVVLMAKTFVESALAGSVEAAPVEEQQRGVMSLFAGVAHVKPDLFGASQLTVAASSLANVRTGTLYTIRIDIPAGELQSVQPQANAIFRTITVDDEI